MKYYIALCALIIANESYAFDCKNTKPFSSAGNYKVKVSVSRFEWIKGKNIELVVCTSFKGLNWFNVQAREDEAFYCLKPNASEVSTCKVKLNGDEAEIQVVPALWIRNWKLQIAQEHRFHAFVVKNKKPGYFYDIFSRSLSFDLKPKTLTLEGAMKTGSDNPEDGYWIRVDFL